MNTDFLKGKTKEAEGFVENKYGEATGNTSAQLEGSAKQAEGKVLSVFGKIQDDISGIVHSAEERTEHLRNHIKEKPVPSALIALGIGFLLGRFFL